MASDFWSEEFSQEKNSLIWLNFAKFLGSLILTHHCIWSRCFSRVPCRLFSWIFSWNFRETINFVNYARVWKPRKKSNKKLKTEWTTTFNFHRPTLTVRKTAEKWTWSDRTVSSKKLKHSLILRKSDELEKKKVFWEKIILSTTPFHFWSRIILLLSHNLWLKLLKSGTMALNRPTVMTQFTFFLQFFSKSIML